MFYHSHPNTFQLLEAISEVQTDSYVKMNSVNSRNIRRNKKTVDKEKFLQHKLIQCREVEISMLQYIKAVTVKIRYLESRIFYHTYNNTAKLAALAQMVACMPLVLQVPGFDPRRGSKFSFENFQPRG